METALTHMSDDYANLERKVKELEAGKKEVNQLIETQKGEITAVKV